MHAGETMPCKPCHKIQLDIHTKKVLTVTHIQYFYVAVVIAASPMPCSSYTFEIWLPRYE